MTNQELIVLVVSPVFVISLVQVLRKYFPKIDGRGVLLVTLLVSVSVCVSERMLDAPAKWYQGVATGVLLAAVAIGMDSKANHLLAKLNGKTKHSKGGGGEDIDVSKSS